MNYVRIFSVHKCKYSYCLTTAYTMFIIYFIDLIEVAILRSIPTKCVRKRKGKKGGSPKGPFGSCLRMPGTSDNIRRTVAYHVPVSAGKDEMR